MNNGKAAGCASLLATRINERAAPPRELPQRAAPRVLQMSPQRIRADTGHLSQIGPANQFARLIH
jgi:hypothetical protein